MRNTEKASLAGSQCAWEKIVGDELQESHQKKLVNIVHEELEIVLGRDVDAI